MPTLHPSRIVTTIFAFCLAQAVHAHTDGGLMVKNAWVREAPPAVKVMAAYMTIENHTSSAKELVSITSSAFKKVEIHKTVLKDGMASMQKQDKISIPAEKTLKLEPNGTHLMLFDPANPLKANENVSFTLTFANGSKAVVIAKVKKALAMNSSEHEHAHNHGHADSKPETHDSDHSHSH